MENRRANRLVISLMMTVTLAPRCMAANTLQLTLVLYNHAQVGPETLAAAENTVSEIFTDANVQLTWRDGFAYAAERRAAVNPPPEDPATLVVKLQPESEAARYGVKSVCGGIGFPSGAIVFVRGFDSARLAYVMAHELGAHDAGSERSRHCWHHARDLAARRLGESCATHSRFHVQPESTDPNVDRPTKPPLNFVRNSH
jgi:hypothetical protein